MPGQTLLRSRHKVRDQCWGSLKKKKRGKELINERGERKKIYPAYSINSVFFCSPTPDCFIKCFSLRTFNLRKSMFNVIIKSIIYTSILKETVKYKETIRMVRSLDWTRILNTTENE